MNNKLILKDTIMKIMIEKMRESIYEFSLTNREQFAKIDFLQMSFLEAMLPKPEDIDLIANEIANELNIITTFSDFKTYVNDFFKNAIDLSNIGSFLTKGFDKQQIVRSQFTTVFKSYTKCIDIIVQIFNKIGEDEIIDNEVVDSALFISTQEIKTLFSYKNDFLIKTIKEPELEYIKLISRGNINDATQLYEICDSLYKFLFKQKSIASLELGVNPTDLIGNADVQSLLSNVQNKYGELFEVIDYCFAAREIALILVKLQKANS